MTDGKATRLSKVARELNVGISTIVDFLHKKGQEVDSNPNSKISLEQYNLLVEEFSSDISIKKESEKVNLRHFKDKQQSITINDLGESPEESSAEQDELLIKDTRSADSAFDTGIKESEIKPKVVGKIDLSALNQKTRPKRKTKEEKKDERLKKEREKKELLKKDLEKSASSKRKIEEEIEEETIEETEEVEDQVVTTSDFEEDVFQTKVEKLTGPTVLGKIELPESKKLVASSTDKPKKTRKHRSSN